MSTRLSLALTISLALFGGQSVFGDIIGGSEGFVNGDILDAPDNTVMSTITITESGSIEDITVTIEGIEHTNVGDLIAELRFLGDNGPDEPAYLFFRPNVDGQDFLGSRSNFGDGQGGRGTYSFGSTGADLWEESAIGDEEDVPQQQYFTSDELGLPHDLGGSEFFEGFNTQGQWQLVITDANDFGFNEGFVESWSIEFDAVVDAIPEPSSALLIVCGAAAVASRRRR